MGVILVRIFPGFSCIRAEYRVDDSTVIHIVLKVSKLMTEVMWDFVVLFPAIERDYINLINDSPNSGKSEKNADQNNSEYGPILGCGSSQQWRACQCNFTSCVCGNLLENISKFTYFHLYWPTRVKWNR